MLKIKVICVGKLKEKFYKDAQDEFLKRLKNYANLELIEINDLPIPEKASLKDEENLKKKEFENMLKRIDDNSYVIALDLNGKEFDSVSFSKKIEELHSISKKSIVFMIGGSLGFPSNLKDHINESICISKMTFTHQMARLLLLEQIYRSFKILNNETYHK